MKILSAGLALLGAAASPNLSYDWKLTPAGWGPVRMGMDRGQVNKALKIELQGEAFDNEGSCIELYAPDNQLPGMYFMFLDGKLSRISAASPSTLRTPRGMGIGSPAAEVRTAYGATLQAEPHHYLGEPAEYLTYWLKPKVRGVRFETDVEQKVERIHAGDDSILLVEGCA